MLYTREGLTIALATPAGRMSASSTSCSVSILPNAYVEAKLRRDMRAAASAAAVSGGEESSCSTSWLWVSRRELESPVSAAVTRSSKQGLKLCKFCHKTWACSRFIVSCGKC